MILKVNIIIFIEKHALTNIKITTKLIHYVTRHPITTNFKNIITLINKRSNWNPNRLFTLKVDSLSLCAKIERGKRQRSKMGQKILADPLLETNQVTVGETKKQRSNLTVTLSLVLFLCLGTSGMFLYFPFMV